MKANMVIIVGLLLGIIIQIIPNLSSKEKFEVMPIFTPVSLQYEKAYQEGKKPKRIPDMMRILQEIDSKNMDSKMVETLKKERMEMLRLRNERHELNIKMMENSISVLSELTPEQWEFVQSNRDEIQSKIELDILEQLLQDLPN